MKTRTAPARRSDDLRNAEAGERLGFDDLATELILRHGATILRDARRYSVCQADAEDAYQRSLVILLTKAPTRDPEQLVPWLRVVVRREAALIAKSRARDNPLDETRVEREFPALEAGPEEHVFDAREVDVAVEALNRLTTDQVKCLVAQARGNTYEEIAATTGFTKRKVSRCVNEGRLAFVQRVSSIEAGSECARVMQTLTAIAREEEHAVRSAAPHLAHCPACRKSLREYQRAPQLASMLFPPALVTAPALHATAGPAKPLASLIDAAVERATMQAHAVQQWLETGVAKKLGVATAIAALLASGGAFVQRLGEHADTAHAGGAAGAARSVHRAGATVHLLDALRTPPYQPSARVHARSVAPRHAVSPAPRPAPPQPATTTNAPVGDGSSEFLPESR